MTLPLRTALFLCLALLLTAAASAQDALTVGANVNMVSGASFPNGDPFQRQQNEPSVAFSSRNSLHLLAGANDYRAVDVPGLPGGRETGDSWLSYFWSTNGGATWKSTLIPGYPQDPDCQGPNPPTLCGYAAGADPVVRAGVNGMFYYSGIVFERGDPSRSAIFVSRFIDLNNDEGGDPIRFLDTTIIDANNDGAVFLDKSWIGVDIPRDIETDTFSVLQSDGSPVNQTVACGNIYVGYAAIGGEGQDLRSEIRLATSLDCGNSWAIQPISEPDTLNQGANIAIHPLTGDLHVVWRRFDTVESFLGISPTGCPASPASWKVNSDWPVSSIELEGDSYSIAQAQDLLGTKHRGDESIKLAYEVIAAKLNVLTGGGDPVDGFNPWLWAQDLTGLIADAEAWFADNPIGSDPKQQAKKDGQTIKKNIQAILQGSGSCTGEGSSTTAGTTGESNAIIIASSDAGGESFSAPTVINESTTFDQGSTRFSFRTTAYPTVAVDAGGRIYVAWAARGFATIRGEESDGDARIVLSTSTDGTTWNLPYAVDEPNREGHQIKPSVLFAGGQLTLVYYDFRQDVSDIFEGFVVDLPEPDRLRHTVDVRVATAIPVSGIEPVFTDYTLLSPGTEPIKPSSSASRYAFVTSENDVTGLADVTVQVQYMVPNFPMFADGTTPFIGDYVDIAAPNLINDGGTWRFASNPGDVQVWQAVWSDNRDVIPPPDGDWSKYVAPIPMAQQSLFDPTVIIPSCEDVTFPGSAFPAGSFYTGTRNQNVYSASISNGVIVAAPGNNRPLDDLDNTGAPLQRSFVVYVQNTTGQARDFRLTLPSTPAGVEASFALDDELTTKIVEIPAYSSAVATVFATGSGAAVSETILVSVVELGGTLTGSVLLNSDPGAPDPLDISLQTAEVHNPAILNPAILNPAILNASVDATTEECVGTELEPSKTCVLNPAILNPAILNPAIFNPAILNPAIFNPAIFNPAILNPAIFNPAILNPAILNPAIFNPAIFNPAILNPAILNPAILNPAILNPAILNPAILNPAILNPAILNPAILNPAILNTTLTEATQQVDVTFSVRNDGTATTGYDLNLAAEELEGLDYELMVYRLNETPVASGCTLTTEAQQQLIFNQTDPLNKAVDGSFYLEPDQEVLVTFRVLPDLEAETPLDPVASFASEDLGGLVIAQPLNTDPATQPPVDLFGPPANVVLGTAGGTVIGAGGTAPLNAGPLAAGEQVSVTATGFVQIGPSPGFELTTPNGSGAPCNSACLLPGAPPASLVARIGTGPWQFVGTGPTILTATSAGDLEFGINDNGYGDNTGEFYVAVSPVASCDIAGDWSGPFTQGSITYPVVVTNLTCGTPGSVIAEVEYPTLPCSGDWTLDAIVGDTLFITETVTGTACVPVVAHELTLDGGTLNGVTPGFNATFSLLPTLTSNFALDADGWTIVNDGGGWVPAGGNPLGYIEGIDTGAATGSTAWYFGAPAKFLGNQSAAYGGELRYDLQRSDNSPSFPAQPWVVLRGAGVALVFDASASDVLPGPPWTSFAVPLDAADPRWHIAVDGCWTFNILSPQACNFSGPAPSEAQFVSVLSSLDTLLIRGEYSTLFDVGGLDNVVLENGAGSMPMLTNADFESISGGGTFPAATDWGGNTQTALHSGFGPGNPGSPDLGVRFGFNGNTQTAASTQTTEPFTANTAYTFRGWSTDSDLNVDSSNIQFSIGYLDGGGVFQSLASATYDTDGFTTWQQLPGVTYTTGASGIELGQNITVQIQAVYLPGFNVGVWFDNLELLVGSFTQYTNETAFLSDSGATAQVEFLGIEQNAPTQSPVCNVDPVPGYVESGFTLQHACGYGYATGDISPNLPGREIVFSGAEQVDISMPGDFSSFGIRIEDGNIAGSGCPALDSSFTLTFKDGNTLVGQIQIDPPLGQGSFIGVTSTVPFDNLEIREVGAPLNSFAGPFCENDYFGTIFTAP